MSDNIHFFIQNFVDISKIVFSSPTRLLFRISYYFFYAFSRALHFLNLLETNLGSDTEKYYEFNM